MSRSIHTTRRDREKAHRSVYRDEAKKSERIRLIDQSLDRKRLTKESVRDVRRISPAPFTPVDVDAIKISAADESPYVHYPAGITDLTGVMRRLPPGILNGVASIALSLGAEVQEEAARVEKKGEAPDPWTGRLGYEGLPGVFNGRILGQRDSEAHILLYAYVYNPENPGLRNWMILLRLWSLATFVHELAHHFDHTQRVARGRWLAEGERKVEGFAEGIEYDWTQKYVVPYLEETYPDEVDTTRRWIAHYGGVMLPLSALAADPRVTENGIVGVFNIQRTIEELVSDISKGTLSKSFYDGIDQHRIPIEREVLAALANAPGVLDFYVWLVWRSFTLRGRLARIPLLGPSGLSVQLGNAPYAVERTFRLTVQHWLRTVRAIWPECPAKLSEDGNYIAIHRSHRSCAIRPVQSGIP